MLLAAVGEPFAVWSVATASSPAVACSCLPWVVDVAAAESPSAEKAALLAACGVAVDELSSRKLSAVRAAPLAGCGVAVGESSSESLSASLAVCGPSPAWRGAAWRRTT